ncbi:MAG: ShlB/FhaC/HecB family hemolysin secretion/activation protein [Desulfobacterales bacterium]|nr:ShlB/FhaC/HecB family hemolysin secretion/activation protein [Desulfobacterales bacterium]
MCSANLNADTTQINDSSTTMEQKSSQKTLPALDVDESQLSAIETIDVKQIKLEGNTVFPSTELAEITQKFEGRNITADELQSLKQALTRYYIDHGYVNSGAIIPDQKVNQGIILIQLIEGKLSEMTIQGNQWLRTPYIASRLSKSGKINEHPLNVNDLQADLKLLKQDPLIANVNADIKPGIAKGTALLNVDVEEARPYHLAFLVNNHNSPSIGSYRGEISAEHLNLTGWGDSLQGTYGLTEGVDDYLLHYQVPVTRWGTLIGISTDRTKSVIISDEFNDLDIRNEIQTYASEISHPFIKTLSDELLLGLKWEKRTSKMFCNNDPFSYPGSGTDKNGKMNLQVMRFSQQWVNRTYLEVFAVHSSINMGLNKLKQPTETIPSTGNKEPKGKFIDWLGQFQWIRRLPWLESQLISSLNLQLSNDPLVPIEKMAIGGSTTVRGYRENEFITDNGITGSVELRVPVIKWQIPRISRTPQDGGVRLATFCDYGHGWNTQAKDPQPNEIYSLGLGVLIDINRDIHADMYWAKGLKDVIKPSEYDLQDDGFHFEITAQLF